MLGRAYSTVRMGRYVADEAQSIRGRGIDPDSLARGARRAGNGNAAPTPIQPEADGATTPTLTDPSPPAAPASDEGESSDAGGSGFDGAYETDESGNSGDAPGHDPSGPGNSENAPGHDEDALDNSLTAPGESDEGSGTLGGDRSGKEGQTSG